MPLERAAAQRLSKRIGEDLRSLNRLDAALEKFRAGLSAAAWDSSDLWATATVLHHLYNAIENVFDQTARTFGEQPATGERWHRDLLLLAAKEVPGARPAIVPASLLEPLADLLGFRHVLRHSYSIDLDPQRLSRLVESWQAHRDEIRGFRGVLSFPRIRVPVSLTPFSE